MIATPFKNREPLISAIVPLFNEQEVVELSLQALVEQLSTVGTRFELICVDDGSSDGTLGQLYRRADLDSRIRVVALSRNFGKEAALAAGLQVAEGDAVLFLDADLQHPPELIPQMLELWQSGYDIVNGVKEHRARESFSYRISARLFNWLMGGAAEVDFRGASDFKLLDRQVADVLRQLPETRRFFRGLVAWSGFRSVRLPYAVKDRAAGKTKWSMFGLIRYSIRNLLAFSEMPLRAVAAAGFSTLIFAALLAAWQLYRFATGTTLSGFTTVILLQLFLDGLLLTGVGIVAVYLAEMYSEVKQRPLYVIRRPRDSERIKGSSETRDANTPGTEQEISVMSPPDFKSRSGK
jgi:dolichol-phosphate mannosyltransferase